MDYLELIPWIQNYIIKQTPELESNMKRGGVSAPGDVWKLFNFIDQLLDHAMMTAWKGTKLVKQRIDPH